jgi:hypothetical protein
VIFFTLGLLLAVLPASGEIKVARSAAPVTVYTQFEQAPAEGVLTALQDEVASIMAPIGLHFEWRSLERSTGREIAVELVVATFKGTCGVMTSTEHRGTAGALGWTHTSNGEVLPFADVECDRISRLLGPALTRMDPGDREGALGRAVGRVLAHELFHVFARTSRHGSWGVAKPFYSVAELLADEFRFEEKESKLLRDSKVVAVLENAAAEDEAEVQQSDAH